VSERVSLASPLAVLLVATLAGCTGIIDAEGELAVDAGPGSGTGADAGLEQRVDGEGLALRAFPNGESKLVARVPSHRVLPVTGAKESGWVPVRFRGEDGWVKRKRVDLHVAGEQPWVREGFNFLLPWRSGKSFNVTQAHGGFSHAGISKWAWDFGLPAGTAVVASHSGRVRKVKGNSKRGGCNRAYIYDANYVTLNRGDGLESHYVHLKSVAVKQGQRVERGQLLGKSGATGYACGAHLHFQVQRSPSGGGGTSGANQSVRAFFWDAWRPVDPRAGTRARSRNNTIGVP